MTLGYHSLANLFPLIEGEEFEELVANIRQNGVREPIHLFEGLILDGRNRQRAADAADMPVRYEVFEGSFAAALEFVISKNLHRRHLTDQQRISVAAKFCNLMPGRPSGETPPIGGITTHDAAKAFNVKQRSIERAKQVYRKATPEIAAAMDRGKLPVDTAARAAKLAPNVQAEIALEAETGKLNVLRTVLKRAARTEREQELGKKQRELPDAKFGVILADPEWRYDVWSRDTGLDRSADNHYPTSDERLIAMREVQKISAKDCVLFLWVTDLARGIRVMESWGFTYSSYFVWVKDIIEADDDAFSRSVSPPGRVFVEVGPPGTGFWNRDRDELLLIGTRGKPPAPAPGTQGESVIFARRPKREDAARGRHSAKPVEIYEWIEKHFPSLPKIELNARNGRPGWTPWGNEAPEETPHDPDTGEVLDDLPTPRPERSRLMPDPERVAKFADEDGYVPISDEESVMAEFITAGQLAQAEAYAAKKAAPPCTHQVAENGVCAACGFLLRPAPEPMEIPAFLKRKPEAQTS